MLNFLLEKFRVNFDQIGLIEAIILQALYSEIVDICVIVCLILARYLRLLLWVVDVIDSIQRITCALLDVFGDFFPDATDSSQLCLVTPLTLENFLQENFQSLHCHCLQIRIRR
jgi:hypothetical protein